jgi:glycogen phosphorylase
MANLLRYFPVALGKATPTPDAMRQAMLHDLLYIVGKDPRTTKLRDLFFSLAYAVREQLVDRWTETMRRYYQEDAKRIYYLSMEFLIGRQLINNLDNLRIEETVRGFLAEMGLDLDAIAREESDAALGNGGLGRLAACYLDSMATLGLPAYGYGIRYEYGMFRQAIENGWQVEHPDNWLRYGNPWEFPRPDGLYPVRFGGRAISYHDAQGQLRYDWVETEDVMAMPYDVPIPGYGGHTVNHLRLWSAKSTRDFELSYFNEGNYIKAVENKSESETLSKVLYPSDKSMLGHELRLKQEYFFVSATLQDILFRFGKAHDNFDQLPDKVAIQLNDTHPALGIAELMRILVDQHQIEWERAWRITQATFAYTNHTLMPEALETWEAELLQRLFPRHLQILYEINRRFLEEVVQHFPGDTERVARLSLFDAGERLRMAHLAIVGCHKVNGVSAIHTDLLKHRIFPDFQALYPDRFINVTNGITPRLWLQQANPGLARLISLKIGDDWITDLGQLRKLEAYADDPAFIASFQQVKQANKARLAERLKAELGIDVEPGSLFDVQVKRFHEYKRQLLNVLHIITLYNHIRAEGVSGIPPRTVIFSGKAAPSYFMAKLIIKLIHDVAAMVNHDVRVQDLLKVAFIPNYGITEAMQIIPAADLSEQLSMAGTEASGTGNMKLALNGALTIGTLDGANIEIGEEAGPENLFIFGLTAEQTQRVRREGYVPRVLYEQQPRLKQALDMIADGYFSPDEPGRYQSLAHALLDGGDQYMVLADYQSYLESQERVNALYRDPAAWAQKAILTVARMGKFSSDRAVNEYARAIWQVKAATTFAPPVAQQPDSLYAE